MYHFYIQRFILDTTNLNAHTAASAGDLEALIALAEKDPKSIKKVDNNGWTPLHEAVRSDNLEVLKWLVSQGLDYNLRTHHGDGGSPLWWAKKYHGKDSKVVKYLEAKGAIDVPPDKEMK
jgi:prolyl 4-hydroxylase